MKTETGKKRRRGRNEGSFDKVARKRKDGSQHVFWRGRARSSYERVIVYGTTLSEARDRLVEALGKARDQPRLGSASRQSLHEFLSTWLEDSIRTTRRPKTYELYEVIVRRHIVPEVGQIPLRKLGPQDVEGMLSRLERSGVSGRLRQLARGVLHRALRQAVQWQLISVNAAGLVGKPRADRFEIRVLESEQVAQLLSTAAHDPMLPLFEVAITTGMRLGELLALRWEDVDLRTRRLSVRRTVAYGRKRELIINEPKTKSGRRNIELPASALRALQSQRRVRPSADAEISPWVFPDDQGRPLRKEVPLRRLQKLLQAAGLPRIRFHDLRHTAATLMLAAGIHPKVVAETLGHSSTTITMDTYSHVTPNMQRDAATRLEAFLHG